MLIKTSIIVISFFMMEMLKRVRWLALAPFMSVMITIPLMSNWSVHLCRGIYQFMIRTIINYVQLVTLTAVDMTIWQYHIR